MTAERSATSTDVNELYKLSETQLIELRQKISTRLRSLQAIQLRHQIQSFKSGERVTIHLTGSDSKMGVVYKLNKKTVSVIIDDGRQWNVAPMFCKRVR